VRRGGVDVRNHPQIEVVLLEASRENELEHKIGRSKLQKSSASFVGAYKRLRDGRIFHQESAIHSPARHYLISF
jgi:hypothetical protein